MVNPSIPELIQLFNADRDPILLEGKYSAMRVSSFRFFRGTSHLFNHDIPTNSFVWNGPTTWNVGDLHIENFGSFKADNRVAYFDLNDFDECILAPNLADLARLTCSLFVAADFLKLNDAEVNHLVKTLTDTYAITLAHGYIRPLEQETATGIIRQFLQSVEYRKRRLFLESRVVYKKHKVRFSKRNLHIRKADKDTKVRISDAINSWAETQPDPRFFNVLDVAHRVAGTGSLGIERFMILVGGPGKLGKEYLLDLKKSLPSTLQARLAANQPVWTSEAERIVEVQKRIQAASPALLHPLVLPDGSYVLRELQPIEDKIVLINLVGKVKKLENLVGNMGQLCAWGHLRSSGRQGSAITDELIEFGLDYDTWRQPLTDYARQYAQQVRTDYAAYCSAYDDGFFTL
ncbi:DUF2252 domain-containing protein [Spirosoma flavum]|uniref:DUF2252 domain-containing protein n=1 Tax=Spirosoma flavum TaxID=2048557 RepID=A0ABW6ANC8_9BACT